MSALPKPETDVRAQAREWFVRLLDEQLSAEEIAAWEGWLREHPDCGAAFDRLTDLWGVAGAAPLRPITPEQLRTNSYDGSRSVLHWLRRPRRLQLVWGASVCALVALGLGATWATPFLLRPMDRQQVITVRAEHRPITLADGSKVLVGGRSRLDVAFSRKQRGMSLVRGEALFQVAHGRARPFVVHTSRGDIIAVGTAFDINVGARTVALEVTEGVVSVEPSDQAVGALRVSAGEKLVLDSNGERLVRGSGDLSRPLWTAGLMEYQDTPLRIVLEDVNRYAERPIMMADPSLGDIAYTGAVQLNNTMTWVKGLGRAFPLVVDTSDAARITLRRRPETRLQ